MKKKSKLKYILHHIILPLFLSILVLLTDKIYFSSKNFKIQQDLYIKNLKLTLPNIRAMMFENIKMIDANMRIIQGNGKALNTLFELENISRENILRYVRDTNIVLSLEGTITCINMSNPKVTERNNLYQSLVNSPDLNNLIVLKEKAIKGTLQKCIFNIEKAQHQLDLVHKFMVNTEVDITDYYLPTN